jgi:hypothetical protein
MIFDVSRQGRTPRDGTRSKPRCCGPLTSCTRIRSSAIRHGRRWPGATTPSRCLDLIFTAGQYTLVSMALNCCGSSWKKGLKGFQIRLNDKVAIVAGAGQASGDTIAQEGAHVVLVETCGRVDILRIPILLG